MGAIGAKVQSGNEENTPVGLLSSFIKKILFKITQI